MYETHWVLLQVAQILISKHPVRDPLFFELNSLWSNAQQISCFGEVLCLQRANDRICFSRWITRIKRHTRSDLDGEHCSRQIMTTCRYYASHVSTAVLGLYWLEKMFVAQHVRFKATLKGLFVEFRVDFLAGSSSSICNMTLCNPTSSRNYNLHKYARLYKLSTTTITPFTTDTYIENLGDVQSTTLQRLDKALRGIPSWKVASM